MAPAILGLSSLSQLLVMCCQKFLTSAVAGHDLLYAGLQVCSSNLTAFSNITSGFTVEAKIEVLLPNNLNWVMYK